jgi:hypothetical protein
LFVALYEWWQDTQLASVFVSAFFDPAAGDWGGGAGIALGGGGGALATVGADGAGVALGCDEEADETGGGVTGVGPPPHAPIETPPANSAANSMIGSTRAPNSAARPAALKSIGKG